MTDRGKTWPPLFAAGKVGALLLNGKPINPADHWVLKQGDRVVMRIVNFLAQIREVTEPFYLVIEMPVDMGNSQPDRSSSAPATRGPDTRST